jgi:uncharacterized protein YgiM (DUF1202 family)
MMAGGLVILCGGAGAALPEQDGGPTGRMVVSWSTWMRAGPSEESRAIDEIGTGTAVDVAGCRDGWCRVREDGADGYVQQRYLAASLQRYERGAGPCFPAQYYTAENALPLTVCPAVKRP